VSSIVGGLFDIPASETEFQRQQRLKKKKSKRFRANALKIMPPSNRFTLKH